MLIYTIKYYNFYTIEMTHKNNILNLKNLIMAVATLLTAVTVTSFA